MPISEKEFGELDGTATRIGGVNPKSMSQRILKVIPDKGGKTQEEIFADIESFDTDEEKKLVMALNALTYDKVKNAKGERVAKVVKAHEKKTSLAYFQLNSDY